MEATRIDPSGLTGVLGAHYQILACLGQGGFGTVFKALQCSTGLTVAVKVQRLTGDARAAQGGTRAARFEREARLCAALDHPNIVRLVDKGQNDEYQYLVFEFVSGETLGQLLARGGALSPLEAVALAEQVLEALGSAHAQGIVHRDLKPENIMVLGGAGERRVKVLDFGVGAFMAGGTEQNPTLTGSQEIVGTPCYAAPEQLRGEPASSRSDIYAWGLVLLECLTGRRVMDGGTAAHVFHKQLSPAAIPLPAAIATHALGDVLRRALTKSTRERAHDAEQLLSELRRVRLNELVGPIVDALVKPATTLALGAAQATGEQRQVTVLSCALMVLPRTEGLADVETLDAIQHDQLSLCADIVARFGGSIAGMLANRIIAVFGLPAANDSDARRAGRAALELTSRIEARRSVLAQQRGIDLELRIGMHTGLVIVDADGVPSGLALNLATRLESLAPAGAALVSHVTRDLLRRLLHFVPHGNPGVTGSSWLSDSYRLVGEGSGSAEDTPSQASSLPLVGRAAELSELSGLWQKARAGAGQALLLRGEPGIGKSRLAHELRSEARLTDARIFEFHCLPEDRHTALAPLVPVLREHFELDAVEPREGSARLSAALSEAGVEVATALPILCSWLCVDDTLGKVPLGLSPEAQRELLLRALTSLLCASNGKAGTLILVEDLHWADPTTRELLLRTSAALPTTSSFLLMTGRSQETLIEARVLELRGLTPDASEQLVQAVLRSRARGRASTAGAVGLPTAVVERIVARTDGIPLFVEELTRDLLGSRRGAAEARDSGVEGLLPVPASLRDLLNSRLDSLGPAKETAQLAAAIGREFDLELLRAVSLRAPEGLQADLDLLVDVQLVRRLPQAGGGRYAFRHALIRDAASESVLSPQRRTLHRAVAAGIESSLTRGTARAAQGQAHAARLAFHYELAGMPDKALENRLSAGGACALSSAYQEAIEHLKAGLALIAALEPAQQHTQELSLRNALGAVLIATQGFASDDVVETFTRCELLLKTGEATAVQRFATLRGLWTFYNARADLKVAARLCVELLALAEQQQDPEFFVVAHDCACQTAWISGRFGETVAHALSCQRWADRTSARERVLRYGVDPWTSALSFAGLANSLIGNFSAAREALAAAGRVVHELQSPAHQSMLLGQEALVSIFEGSCGPRPNQALARGMQTATEALLTAQRYGLRFGEGYAHVLLAMGSCLDGADAGLAAMTQAVQMWKMLGIHGFLSWHYAFLAQGYAARSNYVEALVQARLALDHCNEHGEGYGASEAQRVLGLVLGDPKNPYRLPEEARSSFERAIEIARQQEAHWLELRAAYTFASTFGADAGALAALERSLKWFSEQAQATDSALFLAGSALVASGPPALVVG